MRTRWRFRRGFLRALPAGALLTTLGGVANCGSEASDRGAASDGVASKDSGLDELSTLCGKESSPWLRGLRVDPPIDFIASRREFIPHSERPDAQGTDDTDGWSAHVSDETGTKCATATDKAACESNYDHYRLLPADIEQCSQSFRGTLSGDCFVDYYLYTRGDDVAAARTDDEIRSLVGTVENIDEALILASDIAGLWLNCPGYPGYIEDLQTSQFRADSEGGFVLDLIKRGGCGSSTKACVVHVARNGDMSQPSCTDFPQKWDGDCE